MIKNIKWGNLKKGIYINNLIAVITFSFVFLSCVYFYCQRFLEPKAYDFLVHITAKQPASQEIVNVVIDDQSISEIGRWPWNRSKYTDIFEFLDNYGKAKIIAFDSVIISYDKTGADNDFFNRYSKLNKVVSGLLFTKERDSFSDSKQEELKKLLQDKFTVSVKDLRDNSVIDRSKYFSSSFTLKEMMKTNNGLGSAVSSQDSDGVIRQLEPLFLYNGHYYPSIALAVLLKLENIKSVELHDSYLKIGDRKIPVNTRRDGSFSYIKWYKPASPEQLSAHKTYSAWEIIRSYNNLKAGKKSLISPDEFKDKIVVVGATATALKDIKVTSMGNDYPGVDIQSTSIDNLLNGDFMIRPPFVLRFFILLSLLMLSFVAISYLQPLSSSILLVLMMLVYFQICIYAGYSHNYALDIITPQAFIVSSLAFGYGYKYFLEDNKKRQIQKIMAKYVSKDVMADILNHIDDVKLGGKRAEVTVLFADIRGFTSISETLEPEEVSSILNQYFSAMTPIILNNGGMLDKFMGDALMAIFGAPVESPDHARKAVKCAVEMLEKVKVLQKKWLNEGRPYIEIGIGINTGVGFVGNIGSEDRLEYTVIGDTVNLANRLESFNKIYKTKLLISQSTYEKVKDDADVIRITSVQIKGKTEPVDIYEIIGMTKQKTSGASQSSSAK